MRAQAAFALGSGAALVDNHHQNTSGPTTRYGFSSAGDAGARVGVKGCGLPRRAAGFDKASRLSDALVDCCADALTSKESSTKQAPPKVRETLYRSLSCGCCKWRKRDAAPVP